MNIAVLCPGPSLPRYWGNYGYGLVIGVNTAGWKYPVDWLAFSDRHILEGLTVLPRKGFITHSGHPKREGMERIGLPLYDAKSLLLTPELKQIAADQGMTECAWTFPNALSQANQWAGADGEVHVFGFDCAMVAKDFAGQDGYHKRKRWMTELPWIKSQWTARTLVFSEVPPVVIDWFRNRVPWEAVVSHFLTKEETP